MQKQLKNDNQIIRVLQTRDDKKRNFMIQQLSEHMSKQTIRKYLCLFLLYQNISVLAPSPKKNEKELTKDEKNMRWSLNKFFYTKNGNSLQTSYTMMLKQKIQELARVKR